MLSVLMLNVTFYLLLLLCWVSQYSVSHCIWCNAECHNSLSHILFGMLSVFILIVVKLNVIMLSVVAQHTGLHVFSNLRELGSAPTPKVLHSGRLMPNSKTSEQLENRSSELLRRCLKLLLAFCQCPSCKLCQIEVILGMTLKKAPSLLQWKSDYLHNTNIIL